MKFYLKFAKIFEQYYPTTQDNDGVSFKYLHVGVIVYSGIPSPFCHLWDI